MTNRAHTEPHANELGICRIRVAVEDIAAGIHTLYEIYPDRDAIQPLYEHLRVSLASLLREIEMAGEELHALPEPPPPSLLDTGRRSRRPVLRQVTDKGPSAQGGAIVTDRKPGRHRG